MFRQQRGQKDSCVTDYKRSPVLKNIFIILSADRQVRADELSTATWRLTQLYAFYSKQKNGLSVG